MERANEKPVVSTELADKDLDKATGGRFYRWLTMSESSRGTNGYH